MQSASEDFVLTVVDFLQGLSIVDRETGVRPQFLRFIGLPPWPGPTPPSGPPVNCAFGLSR